MLITASHLAGTKILSIQSASSIGTITTPIIDPDSLKIIAFFVEGHSIDRKTNILVTSSIREYSKYGMVIDSASELVSKDDVIKVQKALELNFNLVGLKVETKKKTKLGHVIDFTLTGDDFAIQQLIVHRPLVKSFIDPELTIPRSEIVEVTDTKIIVKNEENVIKKKAMGEEFIPNFVNPFRKTEQDFAPARTKTPDDIDTE